MADLQSNQISSFAKGINASASKNNQPPNTFPRGSNLVLTRRGSLITCDGSQILFAFNGVPQANSGKFLVITIFQPTGVSNYYLALIQDLSLPIGAPQNLTIVTAAGGSLAAATYYYKVTAIDGAGGETLPSPEVSIVTGASGKNTLTWNVVPNAAGYNVYRSTTSGAEALLIGSPTAILPVPQVAVNSLTASFIDDGTTSQVSPPVIITQIASASVYIGPHIVGITFGSSIAGRYPVGTVVTYAAGSNNLFNGTYTITSFINSTTLLATTLSANPPAAAFSTLGTLTAGTPILPPITDTTQQIALIKMPVIPGTKAILPVSYNNSNIVALFPADLTTFTTAGGSAGGSGGGGGIVPGGTGGSRPGSGSGRLGLL